MTYITQADLKTRWGAENIRAWAARGRGRSAATINTAIDDAIASVEAEIEDRFRGSIYKVPLLVIDAGALDPLKRVMVDLVAAQLAGRGEGDEKDPLIDADGFSPNDRADRLINSYLSGARLLNCEQSASVTGPHVPGVVTRSSSCFPC